MAKKLKNKVKEFEKKLEKPGTSMIVIGTTGFLASIILNSLSMTGFSIIEETQSSSNWVNVLLVVFFLAILFIGVHAKNKEF